MTFWKIDVVTIVAMVMVIAVGQLIGCTIEIPTFGRATSSTFQEAHKILGSN